MSLEILKKRASFLYVREGNKWVTPSLILQARRQPNSDSEEKGPEQTLQPPRFGFTASKKVGNAVERNRTKRRLREAVRHLDLEKGTHLSRLGFDYVLIARRGTLKPSFEELLNDIRIAFKRVHDKKKRSHKKR